MTEKELEDIKAGRMFYIEDRLYHLIYSKFPMLAKHRISTKACTISDDYPSNSISSPQVTKNKNII